MKLFMFLAFWGCALSKRFSTKVLHSPIYHATPMCNLHSVILFKEGDFENPNNEFNDVFAVDFCPFEDIGSPQVILKLLSGKTIQGKIRVFHFDNILYPDLIRELLRDDPPKNGLKQLEEVDPYLTSIIKSWGSSFQLYTRNCRHFSRYLCRYYF